MRKRRTLYAQNKRAWSSGATWLLALLLGALAGCRSATPLAQSAGNAPIKLSPTATQVVLAPVPSPTTVPVTPTAVPAPTAQPTARPTETAAPTATPHPLRPYTLASLRARDFPGGSIRVNAVWERADVYTRYAIDYPSDGLTISGSMHVPVGPGPFPVLILLHGYIERTVYYPGADTRPAAEYFASRGYLVLAPDLRSWGASDSGASFFHAGLVVDVLNLISSLPSLPDADPVRVGVWGHSMGGGVATKVLTVGERVRAAVLYAPNSADDADLIDRWGPGCLPGQSLEAGDHCNPAEIIPPDTSPEIVAAYLAATADSAFLKEVSPIYHLESITAPLQIHIGTADGATLVQTPPEWSARLAEALQAAEKEVDYFTYAGQGHQFVGASWETLLNRATSFFDAHLKSDS